MMIPESKGRVHRTERCGIRADREVTERKEISVYRKYSQKMFENLHNRKHFIRLFAFSSIAALITNLTFLIYAGDIRTDSEAYISIPGDMLTSFMANGRFGLVVTKKLFHTVNYMPAFWLILAAAALGLTAAVLSAVLLHIMKDGKLSERRKTVFSYLFSGLFVTCSVFAHQFYFTYQAFEVAFAFLTGAVGAALIRDAVLLKGPKKLLVLLGMFLMDWSFSTYQALVPYFLSVTALFCFTDLLFSDGKEAWKRILLQAGAFLAGLAVYAAVWKALDHFVYPELGSSLSGSYVLWGVRPLPEIVQLIRSDLETVCLGKVPSFSVLYPVFFVLLLLVSAYRMFTENRKQKALFFPAILFFGMSPFLMTFLTGNYQVVRMHLTYPLVYAFSLSGVFLLLPEGKELKEKSKKAGSKALGVLTAAVCIASCLYQTETANQYEQLCHLTAEYDKDLLTRIYYDARKLSPDPDDLSIIFVGSAYPNRPGTYLEGREATGVSVFSIAPETTGSIIATRTMQCLGLECVYAPAWMHDGARQAVREAGLPIYPAEGSMMLYEGSVAVRVGE